MAFDALDRGAGLVAVQERVIGAAAQGFGAGLCALTDQSEQTFQARHDTLEVCRRTRFAPFHLAGVAGLGERLDQVARQCRGVAPLPAHLAEIGGPPGIEFARAGVLLRCGEELGHIGPSKDLMTDHIQGGQLLAARLGAAVGHDGGHIPA